MNFAIRYLTDYSYGVEVVDNLNALRVKPAANGRQRCDEFNVRLDPEVRLHPHTDYFGTEVNLVHRIVNRALGGEVLVTDRVVESIGDDQYLDFEPIGDVELKGFPEPTPLYVVRPAAD